MNFLVVCFTICFFFIFFFTHSIRGFRCFFSIIFFFAHIELLLFHRESRRRRENWREERFEREILFFRGHWRYFCISRKFWLQNLWSDFFLISFTVFVDVGWDKADDNNKIDSMSSINWIEIWKLKHRDYVNVLV